MLRNVYLYEVLRRLWTIWLLLFAAQCIAQDKMHYVQAIFPAQNLEAQLFFLQNQFPKVEENDIEISLDFVKVSPYSKHYTFSLQFQGYKILDNYIKVHTKKNNEIIVISNHLDDFSALNQSDISRQANEWQNHTINTEYWAPAELVTNQSKVIQATRYGFDLLTMQQSWSRSHDKSILLNKQNEVVNSWNHTFNLNIDTFINANVFSPDPLTYINQNYGAPYVDNNDNPSTWFNPAYIPVNISATYDNIDEKFYLENQYAKIVDFESPFIAPVDSASPDFFFNRSQGGFEQCMVLYHIDALQLHLNQLGFDTLMNVQAEIDAQGQFGADNSVFNRNNGAPTMSFGTGGVDDAEDADVIIHEYAHGLSWSANNNGFLSNERNGLDEGIGDYFATSYSRSLSNFQWENVFSWDGHNEFWDGRTANKAMNYSIPFGGGLYEYGEVWNTAMQKIYTDLGRITTDALMLETLFYLTDNTTLPQAALYMLQADTVLFNGVNTNTLCNHFSSKNILTGNCFATQIKNQNRTGYSINLKNSLAFSAGIGELQLDFAGTSLLIEIFNLNGQSLLAEKASDRFKLAPNALSRGIYLLKVSNSHQAKTFKIAVQ